MITASRPRERELLLLSTDSVSLPATANPPRLSSFYLSASSASIRLSLPHFVSLFPFPLVCQSAPTFSISFHTTRRDATPRFSVTLLFQSVSRSASGIAIQPSRTHTPKGISSTALNTAAACAPSRSPVPAYRDVSCISIYKSYYIRVYRHSYDRTCEPDRPLSSSRAPGVDRINCLFPWRLLIGPSFASRFNVAPLFTFLAPARGLTRQATGNLPPEVPITLSGSFPTAQLPINTPFMLFSTVTFFY